MMRCKMDIVAPRDEVVGNRHLLHGIYSGWKPLLHHWEFLCLHWFNNGLYEKQKWTVDYTKRLHELQQMYLKAEK